MLSRTSFPLRLLVGLLLLLPAGAGAQSYLLIEDFGTGAAYTASVSSTGAWAASNGSPSDNAAASAGGNAYFTGATGATGTLVLNAGLSTVGYNTIRVLWSARATSGFSSAVSFEWSTDGSTWNAVSYTQVSLNGSWARVNGGSFITLPAGAEGAANLRLRWSTTSPSGTANFRIDDVIVQATPNSSAQAGYYYRTNSAAGTITTGANWSLVSNWEASADGSTGWAAAIQAPTSAAAAISVQSGHKVVISSAATASTLVVNGTLEVVTTGSLGTLTVSDGAGADDLAVNSGGLLVFSGSGSYASTFIISSPAQVRVKTGGTLRNSASGGGWSALGSASAITYETDAVFDWNDAGIIASSASFFPNAGSGTIPILRVSVTASYGSGSANTINGRVDITGTLTTNNGGTKVFRNGVSGTGTLNQSGTSGLLLVNGATAQLGSAGGTLAVNLNATGLSVTAASVTLAGSLTTGLASGVSGSVPVKIDGAVLTAGGTVAIGGVADVQLLNGATLKTAHAAGLSGTLATTGTVDLTGGTVEFNGTVAQTVSVNRAFKDLVISNSGSGVTISSSCTVSGAATVSGKLYFGSTGTLGGTGSFTLQAGATLGVSSANGVAANGNVTVSGAQSYSGGAHYVFQRNASGAQVTGALLPVAITGSLTVALGAAADAPLTLSSTTTVSALTLTSGRLDLGARNLLAAAISGGGSSAYVVAGGTGSLVLNAGLSGTQLLPVGASASVYSPVSITSADGLRWAVRAQPGFSGYPAVNQSTALQVVWLITPSATDPLAAPLSTTPGGTALAFQYPDAAWTTPAEGKVDVYHFNASGTGWSYGWTRPYRNVDAFLSGGMRTVTVSGQQSFSPFAIGAPSTPLPVTLVSFTGKRVNNANELSWSTASEQNNAGFDVERSANGREFARIATVASQGIGGNSSSVIRYTYSDRNASGKWYYRLKQVDFDGRFKYSNIITINAEQKDQLYIDAVYPNPAKDVISVRVQTASSSGDVFLQLSDMAGRIVKVQQLKGGAGTSTTATMDISALASGVYHLKVVGADGGVSETTRIVKQ